MKKTTAAPDVKVKQMGKARRLAKIRTQIPYWVMLLLPLTFFIYFCR